MTGSSFIAAVATLGYVTLAYPLQIIFRPEADIDWDVSCDQSLSDNAPYYCEDGTWGFVFGTFELTDSEKASIYSHPGFTAVESASGPVG